MQNVKNEYKDWEKDAAQGTIVCIGHDQHATDNDESVQEANNQGVRWAGKHS